MKSFFIKIALLICISFLSFIFWFIEITTKGWTGLEWISYNYISPLLSINLFAIYIFIGTSNLQLKKRIFISISYLLSSILLYLIYFYGLHDIYSNRFNYNYFLLSLLLVPFFVSLCHFLYNRIFKITLSKAMIIISFVLLFLSLPIALLLNQIIFGNEYGTLNINNNYFRNDVIHSIKTGTIFIGIMFFSGLPYLKSSA